MERICMLFAVGAVLAALACAQEPTASNEAQVMPTLSPAKVHHDLSDPAYDPPDAPAWCKETLPDWVQPYLGKNGLGSPWGDKPGPLATGVKGVDRYQANHFVVYRPETAKYLYGEYTPLKVDYKKGSLPTYEAAVAKYTAGCKTDTEKAVALLTKAMPALTKHPTMPPCGPGVSAGRGLEDEPLLQSGLAWCNEQARVFCRLCQVAGMPARIVHLFYSDRRSGHTIAEFYADGRWAMADASWFTAFPGPDGKLLSAAQCHDRGEGQKYAGIAYEKRFAELVKLSDKELYSEKPEKAAAFRKSMESKTAKDWAAQLDLFALMNNPLPQ